MRGGWADQLKGEEGMYSPVGLQASWDVWDTWNCLLDIKKRGGNTECNLWRDQWVNTVGRVGGGETWQGDLPKDPKRLQRPIILIMDLIEELYSPRIARDSMDDEGEEWGCRQLQNRHLGRLQAIQVVKGHSKGRIVKLRNAQK